MEEKKEVVTIVLFGGTGDLTRKKLVPAFAKLVESGRLDRNSTIIGISRKDWTDDQYKEFLISGAKREEDKKRIELLNVKHLKGDFSKKGGIDRLKPLIMRCEPGKKCSRIYYLSTSFNLFPNIVKELQNYNLNDKSGGFTRVAFEKPFGEDLKSSDNLDKEICKIFTEEDIYRIDHYLAKETVQNLNFLKFTNPILFSTLNNQYVEEIEIVSYEKVGVGNRVEYYNNAGAIKDMIQSHLLQMLSLVLMRRPKKFRADEIHDRKVEVLKNLQIAPVREHLIGQYKSYSNEVRVKGLENRDTETFAKVILNCKLKEWDGVKLTLKTGKNLKSKIGRIRIKFKGSEKFDGLENVRDNEIIIGLYPKQDVDIIMNTRDPNTGNIEQGKFEFCHECKFGPNTTDEYAVLLGEILKGDKTLFTRSDEVRESWNVVDKIEKMKSKIPFVIYEDGTDGEDL